jgi:hypothetical protein
LDEEIRRLQDLIESNDVSKLAIYLRVHPDYATGNSEIMTILTSLLADRRLCLIGIPYHFGEIRYLAALALQEERKKAGITVPMEIEVVLPLTPIQIGNLADQYGIESLDTLEQFSQLIAMNVVEMAKFSI